MEKSFHVYSLCCCRRLQWYISYAIGNFNSTIPLSFSHASVGITHPISLAPYPLRPYPYHSIYPPITVTIIDKHNKNLHHWSPISISTSPQLLLFPFITIKTYWNRLIDNEEWSGIENRPFSKSMCSFTSSTILIVST